MRRLAAEQGRRDKVSFITYSVRAGWVRDFAPYAVELRRGAERQIAFVDTTYQAARLEDDFFPVTLIDWLDKTRGVTVPRREMLLQLSWGNFMSNGDGTCAMTSEIFYRNAHLGDEDKLVPARLEAALGCDPERLVLLPRLPLTIEHVDEIAKFLPGDRVLVGTLRVPKGPHAPGEVMPLMPVEEEVARGLDSVAQIFAARGFEAIRVPTLPPTRNAENVVLRSYVNSLFVNRHILVPAYLQGGEVFRGVDVRWLDAHVNGIFARALPEHRVLQVDVSDAVELNGSLHCLTMGLPGLRP